MTLRACVRFLASMLVLAGCRTDSSELPDGYDRERTVVALSDALEADGFEVDRGDFVFFEIEDCEGRPTCYGNNPSSPYGLFRIPPAPGEDVSNDPGPLSNATGRTAYRLREDEALLFLGRTPPAARYFSFISYVASRGGVDVFGSVVPPDNHLTLATSGPDEDPFDRETALVVTADRNLADDLTHRLERAGLGSLVNVQLIPNDLVRLGHDATDDVLTMLFRVALFEDPVAGRAYLDAPPSALLRIRPSTVRAIAGEAFTGYPIQGTGTNESALEPAMTRLHDGLVAHYADATVVSSGFVPLSLIGSDCVSSGWQCNGDNPDTVYWAILPRTLGPNERIVVYGVDHRRAGKATYTNVSAYEYDTLTGSVAAHDGDWGGSASAYLPSSDPDADRLFVWSFARDCGGDAGCTEVPTTFPGVAADANLTLVVRAYLEQATATAPSVDEVIAPRVLFVTMP